MDEILEAPDMPEPWDITLPHRDITFACVVWQDEQRLRALLQHVRPYFDTLAVVVQESTDKTFDVAFRYADVVMRDSHKGFGDASFGPLLLPSIKTTWTFKVDADEFPSPELLWSLPKAVEAAEQVGVAGVWIPFQSAIEGEYWNEQHSHLRLFHTHLGWPATLHSRPPVWRSIIWRHGFIDHSRSLDEMVKDYLSYYEIGRNNVGWTEHNLMMMREACKGTAGHKGWDFVKSHDWWPRVRELTFGGAEQYDEVPSHK